MGKFCYHTGMIDVKKIKKDFPIFQNIPNLVYLDSTATSLKPRSVLEKGKEYYQFYGANIFRGVYPLSEKATEEYEKTRKKIALFINAQSENEIVFTRNTTESINLVAFGLGRYLIKNNDEVVITLMEHHANFVPWQILCEQTKARLRVVGVRKENGFLEIIRDDNEIDKRKLAGIINKKTKIFALTYVSNVLGTVNPVKKIVQAVKEINDRIIIVLDAAQALPHFKVDVQDLGVDFLAASGHKMLAPTGIGILWGKYSLLKKTKPVYFGGEMIEKVTVDKTSFKDPPYRFEAGTPAIAQAIALSSAVRYLEEVGLKNIEEHEKKLAQTAMKRIKEVFGDKVMILGEGNDFYRAGIISFNIKGIHPHDLAYFLGQKGICLRSGHHCAMPLHQFYGVNGSVRASFYLYNDYSDVDLLIEGIKQAIKFFK